MRRQGPIDPRNIEVMDDAMAEVLRQKTAGERFMIGCRLFSSARKMLTGYVRQLHPDWTEEQIQREVARRISHGAV